MKSLIALARVCKQEITLAPARQHMVHKNWLTVAGQRTSTVDEEEDEEDDRRETAGSPRKRRQLAGNSRQQEAGGRQQSEMCLS